MKKNWGAYTLFLIMGLSISLSAAPIDSFIQNYLEGNKTAIDGIDKEISTQLPIQNRTYPPIINITLTQNNIDVKEPLSYVEKELGQALHAFYLNKFWETISFCNNVLLIEEQNELALMRKGSAYYMLGNFSLAQKYWIQAYQVNPNNAQLTPFLGDTK